MSLSVSVFFFSIPLKVTKVTHTFHRTKMISADFEIRKVMGLLHTILINENGFHVLLFPFPFRVMKLHTLSFHESRLCTIDFGLKRSGPQLNYNCKKFTAHNCFLLTT